MTRRKMLWAGSVALLVAVAGVGTMSWRSNNAEPQLDCQIVRELIEYNSAKGKQMAAGFNPQAGTEASLEDYRALADRLAGYSSQLRDAGLAEDTQALADDTDDGRGDEEGLDAPASMLSVPQSPTCTSG